MGTMELLEFLAMECPFLLPAARKDPSPKALLKALDAALALPKDEASRVLYPGSTAAQAVEGAGSALRELLEGFFRRQQLKSSLRPSERVDLYRVMVLSRALDELLKKLFQDKPQAWEGHPSPQKGFRGFGQEAVVGLGLRLQRRGEDGDVICPLIRGLALTLLFTDDPVSVVLS